MYTQTQALKKIAAMKKPIRIVQGGTSAGKTIAILLLLIQVAQTQKKQISVVAESLPHLRKGAMREFMDIMRLHGYYKEENHSKGTYTYHFETGSYIEFFGVEDSQKVRGPRRDILFINEANSVPYPTFRELYLRTRGVTILDYNPISEFWVHDELIPHTEHDFLILTYKDNEALDQTTIDKIEALRRDENLWKVYGLGQVGSKEGQVYPEWPQIDTVPKEARLERRGLDYGYTNNPTAIVAVYKWNDALIFDEEEYRTGLQNQQIGDKLLSLTEPDTLIVPDSAEPKSNDELANRGLNISPAVKGPGSVNFGIDTVKQQKVYVTKRSTNIIKENRNYRWKQDKDGKNLNAPQPLFDHAMDAIRYAVSDMVAQPELTSDDIALV